jgi:hypothetical protein
MIRVCIIIPRGKSCYKVKLSVIVTIIISFEATIGVIFVPVAAYIQSSNVAANITEDHKILAADSIYQILQ